MNPKDLQAIQAIQAISNAYAQMYTATISTNTNTLTMGNWINTPAMNIQFTPSVVPWQSAPQVNLGPQTKYIPAPHGFNKYVNASDLLEEFIAYCGEQGVRKREFMELPVELFIKWLVVRACEVDQEDPGIVLALPAPRKQPRCLGCGKWMKRGSVLYLHGDRCASRHFAREAELIAIDEAIRTVEAA